MCNRRELWVCFTHDRAPTWDLTVLLPDQRCELLTIDTNSRNEFSPSRRGSFDFSKSQQSLGVVSTLFSICNILILNREKESPFRLGLRSILVQQQ